MPGGRLTQQERQQIAIGLSNGLAYAEIARGLDRPTSTVTREVLRNGGPSVYRADLAHRATQRRVSRRTTRSTTDTAHSTPTDRDIETLREYEARLTGVLMASGLPKMMARVLVSLYLTDSGSLTAAEIAQRLNVSPASVSKAIAFLATQSLVRREREGQRRERYVVDDDIWYQSMVASAKANEDVVAVARQGVDVLGAGSPAAVRLENVARFLDFVGESITRAAQHARDVLHTKGESD